MNKSSRIIIDREMMKNIAAIGAKSKEVFACEMTAQNYDIFLDTIIDVHFTHSDNLVELVNMLDTTLRFVQKSLWGKISEGHFVQG